MRLAFRLLGLVILGLVLWFGVDLGALGRRLGAADLRLVGAALALLGPMIFAKTLRWQGLTRVGGKGYAPARAFVVFLVGLYAGSVTPGRLGELLRASYLVRDGAATPGVALASVVGDRLFDLYALLVVAAGGVAWFGLAGRLSLAGLAALATAALSPAALASPRLMGWVGDRFARRRASAAAASAASAAPRGRFARLVDAALGGADAGTFAREFAATLRAQVALAPAARALALTALGYGLFFVQCWWLFRAVGVPFGFVDVAFTMSLVNLVSLLPVTFAGIGTRDAALVALFGLRGLGGDAALAASAAVLLVFYVTVAVAGFVAWQLAPLPAGPAAPGALLPNRSEEIRVGEQRADGAAEQQAGSQ